MMTHGYLPVVRLRILGIFLIISPLMVFCQGRKIPFVEYGIKEGLPEEFVTSIIQDEQGFIWCGTQNGLVKFDGYTMQVFRQTSDPRDSIDIQIRAVNRLINARDGKIWMSVRRDDGIVSFDPETERFRSYRYHPGDSSDIPFPYTGLQFEDLRGNIWFNTTSDAWETALCRLDPQTQEIMSYAIGLPISMSQPYGREFFTEVPSDSSIWLLHATDLWTWNRKQDTFQVVLPLGSFRTRYDKPDTLIGMHKTDGNILLLFSDHGLYSWDVGTHQVLQSYHFIPGQDSTLCQGNIMWTIPDRFGRIWIGHEQGRITIIHPSDGATTKLAYGVDMAIPGNIPEKIDFLFPALNDQSGIWFQAVVGNRSVAYLHYDYASGSFQSFDAHFNDNQNTISIARDWERSGFLKDKTGLLWISALPNFYRQAPKRQQFDLFRGGMQDPGSLPSDSIFYLLEDSRQRLWIGTGRGLAMYEPAQGAFRRFALEPDHLVSDFNHYVNLVFEDSRGQLWVASGFGLYKLNDRTESFDKVAGIRVLAMMEDHTQRLWVSAYQEGVLVMNTAGQVLKAYSHDHPDSLYLPSTTISEMYQDSRGTIWLGDRYFNAHGLFRLNDTEDGFVHYQFIPDDSNSITSNQIFFVFEDEQRHLLIGTNEGLNLYDYEQDRFVRIGNSMNIPTTSTYAIDEEERVWIGTYAGEGLALVHVDSFRVQMFGEKDGLLHNDLVLFGLIPEDDSGRLWLPTQRGLSVFDPREKTFRNYFEQDGFQPCGQRYRALKTSDGSIWIGGYYGLNHIDPEALLEADSTLPDVWITGMTIMDQVYSAPDGELFKKAVSFSDEVRLSHWQKDLSFDFVALHYTEPEDNLYSWRLEPYEGHWSTPSKQRTASYTNLSPGTYTFRVKGSNADGIWNESGDMLRITIAPPWWATWWAYAGYSLLFIGVTWGMMRYRSRQLKQENVRLESKVRERTERLKQSLEDLKASQAQLIQSEKNAMQLQLLGLEKKALQAQMNPHFVFNAMNSVQHLIASGEDKQAMLYLNKFGKLLRSVLDQSDHGFVSLLVEVEMLKNYIALEALRFEDVFQYRIDIDPSLEYEDIRIPGFVIQPVIENAIQHGLLPKKIGGILTVSLVDRGDHIGCIVEDNGVGRGNGKSPDSKVHESKGLNLLRRRLEMLSPGVRAKVINIVDLKSPTGDPVGTRVEIRLPLFDQGHAADIDYR